MASICSSVDLLRHGDTGFSGFRGTLDEALTELGWQQMELAVAGRNWDAVVSSPLQRCAAFAERFSGRAGIPLSFDGRLAELHFGAWEGKTTTELMQDDMAALQNFWQDPEHYPPPGGETLQEFSARVLASWHELQQRYAGQALLVVTHGGVIRRLLCHALGLPLTQMLSLEVAHGSLHPVASRYPGLVA